MAAMHGQPRCRLHGGLTPKNIRAAQRRMAVEKATKVISREKLAPVDDPIGALRELAAEAMAVKRYFGERVNALEQLRYQAGAGEQTRAELTLYGAAFDRAAKLCESLARLNLDERTVRLDEARVALLVAALQGVLADPALGLNPSRQAIARELLVARLAGPT
jgi:hypothetical protein